MQGHDKQEGDKQAGDRKKVTVKKEGGKWDRRGEKYTRHQVRLKGRKEVRVDVIKGKSNNRDGDRKNRGRK